MAPSSPRNGARVIWIAVHTAEGIRKAADLKAYFDRSTNSSAHACADDTVLLDNCVPYDRAAWTLRNGNTRSDNLELCGFAAWSRKEWLNNHQGMLRHAAQWIRARCLARGIPIRKLDAAGVRRGDAGVIGHVDYTNGTGDGTHWDPGLGFPWDVVMSMATGQQEDDVLTPDDGNVRWAAMDPDTGDVQSHEVAHWLGIAAYRTGRIQADLAVKQQMLADILAAVTGGQIDPGQTLARLETVAREAAEAGVRAAENAVRVVVTDTVLPALQRLESALAEDNADEAKAIVTELAERLRPA